MKRHPIIATLLLGAVGITSADEEKEKRSGPNFSFAPAISKVSEAVVTIVSLQELTEKQKKEFQSVPKSIQRKLADAGKVIVFGVEHYQGVSHGSGAVVDSEGYIITNDHVVAPSTVPGTGEKVGGQAYAVIVGSSRNYVQAKLKGTDPSTDIAVLQIDPKHVSGVASPADVTKLRVGDIVFAVGAPRDIELRQSATMGIISALGRSKNRMLLYENFIQTDAAINPGNSGGPLIDITGKIIGFNQSIRLSEVTTPGSTTGVSDSNTGIGFAVPADLAFAIKDQIVKHGKAVRGFLGFRMRELTGAESTGLSEGPFKTGVFVEESLKNTPASEAGIETGDIVLQFGDHMIDNAAQLRLLTSLTPPGEEVDIQIYRPGKKAEYLEKKVVVGNLADSEFAEIGFAPKPMAIVGLSFEFSEVIVPVGLRKGFGADPRVIAVVTVKKGSKAEKAGLVRGHIITHVNGIPVRKEADFQAVVKSTSAKQILLTIRTRTGIENISFEFE